MLRMCYNCKHRISGDNQEFYRCSLKNIDIKEEIEDKCSNFEEKDISRGLKECYDTIIEDLHYFLDMEERFYPIVALWIIGTYAHDEFNTYPYLYINASKGSGKSRLLGLISELSKNGKCFQSITEAVLFRIAKITTLCLDEFEDIQAKEKHALRLLLNSAYKKGGIVPRMKETRKDSGKEYEIQEFPVYTSVAIANISGMESVLGDRCITIRLTQSYNEEKINLIENFKDKYSIQVTKSNLGELKESLCDFIKDKNLSSEWNDYIKGALKTNNKEILTIFKKIKETKIRGRNLELIIPLYFIAYFIDKDISDNILDIFKKIAEEKEEQDYYENIDRVFIRFLGDMVKNGNLEYFEWISTSKICNEFREYTGETKEFINTIWIGLALVRLGLRKDRKPASSGIRVLIDIDKVQKEYERENRTRDKKD